MDTLYTLTDSEPAMSRTSSPETPASGGLPQFRILTGAGSSRRNVYSFLKQTISGTRPTTFSDMELFLRQNRTNLSTEQIREILDTIRAIKVEASSRITKYNMSANDFKRVWNVMSKYYKKDDDKDKKPSGK